MVRTIRSRENAPEIFSTTLEVGWGNRTERLAINKILKEAGFIVVGENPTGIWIRTARWFHTKMSQSTDDTIEYTKKSSEMRNAFRTKPLLSSLKKFVESAMRNHPDAQFFLTPQNMIGEAATEVSINGKKFVVIMVLPDAMGKLSPHRKPTTTQEKINYLVWNRNAYQIMTTELGLQYVQLINPVDPLLGFDQLNKEQLIKFGFQEVFEQENLCVIKLSGGGGDPYLINTVMKALWDTSKVRCIVFPGQEKTEKKLIERVERNSPKIVTSLNEGHFYNVANNMEPDAQMVLAYPSEQFKHFMARSRDNQRLKIAWLPPKGEQELNNLIEYIAIAKKQGITTICIPQKHQEYLHGELKAAGFIPNKHYQLVEPEKMSKAHFNLVPSWAEYEADFKNGPHRIEVPQAVQNIIVAHR